ncbi:MAG TPA: hypothetical protein DCP97_01565, partial [Ruminococcaceae bacterium]|nr:hypothetical protein [Oscillospiraceae bacterium]
YHSSWDEVAATSKIGSKMSVSIQTSNPVGASSIPGASSTPAPGVSSIMSVSGIACPNFISDDNNCGIAYLTFNVENGNDVFVTIKAEEADRNAVLSAFVIDAPDPEKTIKNAQPVDGDMHYDESLGLTWQAASGAVSHDVYLGTDFDSVNTATTASADIFKGNQKTTTYALKNLSYTVPAYWWRVDEHLASGEVVKGETIAFRPRRLAFPTAEGYGRFATGGRGGRIVEVTNLNDSGEGSLRQALEVEKGPRTVIFRVGGVIALDKRISIPGDGGDVYVAGQTAPGDGITIIHYPIGAYGAKDVIIRDIRCRVGDYSGKRTDLGNKKPEAMDGIGMANCYNSIVDHCSISWTTDEGVSTRGARSITYQHNLIAEGLNASIHYNDQTKDHSGYQRHAYGASISGNKGSFHHNLLTNFTARTWSMAGSADKNNKYLGFIDITNNVVYNFYNRMTDGGCKQVNFVNNYYKMGPVSLRQLPTDPSDPFYWPQNDPGDQGVNNNPGGVKSSMWYTWEQTGNKLGFFQIDGNEMCYPDMQMAYLNGNKEVDINGKTIMGTSMEENWANVGKPKGINYYTGNPTTLADLRSNTPFFPSYVKTETADQAYSSVLSNVGANKPKLDKYDLRYISEVKNGTYTYEGSVDHLKGIIDSQDDAGGYPVYPEVKAPADSDGDGIIDSWEKSHNLNPNDASDANKCTLTSGLYTNLEYYLNVLAGDYDDHNDSDDSDDYSTSAISVSQTPASINNSDSIKIAASENAFTKPVDVSIKEDAAVKQTILDAIKTNGVKLPADAAIFPLEINVFVKGTETKIQPMQGESVKFTIPIPTELLPDKEKVVVVRVINGKLEVLPTKLVQENSVYCVEFSADHFSPYALVVDKNNVLAGVAGSAASSAGTGKRNPGTGASERSVSLNMLYLPAEIKAKRKY